MNAIFAAIISLIASAQNGYALEVSSASYDKVVFSEDEKQAKFDSTTDDVATPNWGIINFSRNHKGTARDFEGQNMGYRWPLAISHAMSIVVTEQEIYAYISPDACKAYD
ncbi:MAG: hypothetical protein IJV62_02595, partial [Eggerthellaceae bacterium]|nr:hypothetical protein [Eggerthellaceae bacterium]